jgi:hypothetical protein
MRTGNLRSMQAEIQRRREASSPTVTLKTVPIEVEVQRTPPIFWFLAYRSLGHFIRTPRSTF